MNWIALFASIAAAGLGAGGVAAAAAASHAGGALLDPLALIALTHAPALLALSLCAPRSRTFAMATLALGIGALLFCGDLVARHALGTGLFPMSAPLGGLLLMAGWVATGAAALLRAMRSSGKIR